MTKLVFTSDWHLGHANVLRMGGGRPFADVDDMAERFVEETNRVARPDDRLFILGDISYRCGFERVRPYVEALRCKHKFLIYGNHDLALRKEWAESGLFEFCGDYLEVNPKGYGYEGVKKLVLSHYPFLTWNGARHNGGVGDVSINIHGHLHSQPGTYNEECRGNRVLRYDVGVDANGYAPVTLKEVLDFFHQRPGIPGATEG